jgi:hypothetical protein
MKDDTTAKKEVKKPKPLPAPNSDFYLLAGTLSDEEQAVLKQVRAFMESKVAPITTNLLVWMAGTLTKSSRQRACQQPSIQQILVIL